ncbi:MAG: PspC domain-containing protein [Bacteroidota bacterium]|nr:PspC domain-containing protein [Bacteroidota bacterium]
MQKVLSIHLANQVFQIESDGYDYLKRFFDRYKSEISSDPFKIASIESSIANYFIATQKTVFFLSDAITAVEQLHIKFTTNSFFAKRLFRDGEGRMLGGVSGGIADFFGIDKWIIRVVFLMMLFFGGFGVLIYIILWIAVPKAITIEEKNQMKGNPLDLDAFEKDIRNSVDGFVESNNIKDKAKQVAKRTGYFFGNVVVGIFMFVIKIIGLLILIISVPLIIALLFVYGMSEEFVSMLLDNDVDIMIAKWGIVLLIGLPIIGLILAGINMVWIRQKTFKFLIFLIPIFWVLALAFTCFAAFRIYPEFKEIYYSKTEVPLQVQGNKLYIEIAELINDESPRKIEIMDNKFGFMITDSGLYIRSVAIELKKSPDNKFHAFYVPSTFGSSDERKSRKELDKISYSFQVNNDAWLVQPFIKIPRNINWRAQKVTLILMIPVGKQVQLPNLQTNYIDVNADIFKEEEDSDYFNDKNQKYSNKTLEMTSNGLICTDCNY